MGIVSYAQNFEDVILWRALHGVSPGFYIDIGAQHPVVDSVSKAFYEQGWRGIHVEPTTLHANLLRADRPDETVVQGIIADQAGAMKFYEIEGTGLSTARQDIADEHRAKLSYPVRETLVTAITLSDLLELAPQDDIHWLKVDVEGFERQVFSGWMQSHRRPWIIAVESTYPTTPTDTSAEWESLVLGKGYRLVYRDGLNRFYLHNDHAERESLFAYPPNVFDGFQLSGSATSMTSLLVQRNQKDVSQLESRLAATEEQHRSTAQALVEQQSRAARQTGELQQELGALRSTLQNARKESAERERLTAEAFGQARDEMRLHAQLQLENLLRRERELGEQLLRQQEAARQSVSEMTCASAEREAALQQELATLRAALELAKEQAAARERQQQEAFRLVRDEMSRKALAQLQALLDRERELHERLLQQQEAARQNAVEICRASAERDATQQQELATLRTALEQAAVRERQQQETFNRAQDYLREEAQAQLQVFLDRERELSERLRQQQETAHQNTVSMAQVYAEREARLVAQAKDCLTLHSQQTHYAQLEREAMARQLEQERSKYEHCAAALTETINHIQQLDAEIERLYASWSWRLSVPLRWFSSVPKRYAAACLPETILRTTVPASAPTTRLHAETVVESALGNPSSNANKILHACSIETVPETPSVVQENITVNVNVPSKLEDLLLLPPESFIDQAFRILLGRAPDPVGKHYYMTRLHAGYGRYRVLAQLAQSKEYKNRQDSLLAINGNEQFVDALYERYLGRLPDPEGKGHYLKVLSKGGDRKRVLNDVVSSSEAFAKQPFLVQIEKLLADEAKAKHWFWRWFGMARHIEQQLNQQHEILVLLATQSTSAQALILARLGQLEQCLRHGLAEVRQPEMCIAQDTELRVVAKQKSTARHLTLFAELKAAIASRRVK